MSETAIFEVFPVNGLDRSLHAPVFVGLIIITFFAETLGWTFAGLVVPGYFVSVILAAPATAVLVTVETVVTYFVCAALGKWVPRTQAWSTAFGRERFFLFILVALAVRLAVEANLLPWLAMHYDLPHSRQLHSLGLVLVPLVANMFWNDGFVRSSLHVTVLIGLTYLCVDGVLLEYTNFTVSRFEVANESVSLSFLEAPHAQFILLIGALIAARANVLYGWDYNGILVPALLSVAWYQPTKLATTVAEAVVVYGLARGVATLPPLSSLLLVGTRRSLLVFTVGFVVKWAGGFAMQYLDPTLHVIDYLGFGYLLPTLLAVKMWNRNAIGTVIVPTVQVSVVAFVIGNLAGFALATIQAEPATEVAGSEPSESGRSTALELLLMDTPRAVSFDPELVRPRARLAQAVIGTLADGRPLGSMALRKALLLNMRVTTTHGTSGGSLVLGPQSVDPDRDVATPRVAVRLSPFSAASYLVVAIGDGQAGPTVPAAEAAARLVDARALVLRAQDGRLAALDTRFAHELADRLAIEQVLFVESGEVDELSVVGRLPESVAMERWRSVFGPQLGLRWRGLEGPGPQAFRVAMRLSLTHATAARAAARVLEAPDTLRWEQGVGGALAEHLDGITTTRPFMFDGPSIEELRLFKARVLPEFLRLDAGASPDSYARALAGQLGYRFLQVSKAAGGPPGAVAQPPVVAWGLVEPAAPTRRGHATWIRTADVQPGPAAVLVESPASRWEIGTYRASMVLFDGLPAAGVLLSGAPPNADAEGRSDARRTSGRRSFYHLIHQAWIDAGGRAVVVHGIAPDRDPGIELVVSTGRELSGLVDLPVWGRDVAGFFADQGFELAVFDGSSRLAPFDGGYDPALGYARRFAPDSTLLLWFSPGLRRHLVRVQEDRRTELRLGLAGVLPVRADVATRAARRSRCLTATGSTRSPACDDMRSPPTPGCPASMPLCRCEPEGLSSALEAYSRNGNPHGLRVALAVGSDCRLEVLRDVNSGLLWALAGAGSDTWLVPLLGGPVRRQPVPVNDDRGLRRLVTTGLASSRVQL